MDIIELILECWIESLIDSVVIKHVLLVAKLLQLYDPHQRALPLHHSYPLHVQSHYLHDCPLYSLQLAHTQFLILNQVVKVGGQHKYGLCHSFVLYS